MFGYTEPAYTVLKHVAVPTKCRGQYELEVRQPIGDQGDAPRSYIALVGKSKEGKVTEDRLFLYGSQACLDDDWSLLASDKVVSSKDLNWTEVVDDHHVGFGKDGSVSMY